MNRTPSAAPMPSTSVKPGWRAQAASMPAERPYSCIFPARWVLKRFNRSWAFPSAFSSPANR